MLDDATPIWRYMSLAKLIALLDTKSLHFTQVARFTDPYEATYARGNIDANRRRSMLASVGRGFPPYYVKLAFKKRMAVIRYTTYANCWHANEYESAAMWDLYSREGIAVRSSLERLQGSVDTAVYDLSVREVMYIDYEAVKIPEDDPLALALCKRHSFSHEREIRALIRHGVPENTLTFDSQGTAPGIDIGVDVESLVESVFVAPKSPDWVLDTVRSVLQKFGFDNIPVIRSSLDDPLLV